MADRIAELELRLAAVEQRLAALEGERAQEVKTGAREADEDAPQGDGIAAAASAQAGRILLVFGGAYFLRAITEGGFVPAAIGLLLGAIYAVSWLFVAYRAARLEEQRLKASFLAGTSVLLTLPLLHEATTRFAMLSGTASIICLTVFALGALTLTALRDLKVVAWLVVAGSIATAIGSLIATQAALPVVAFLIVLGFASLWATYWRDWIGLQWLGALGAIVGVLATIGLSMSEKWQISVYLPIISAIVLLSGYLLSFTYQTHVRGRLVNVFEAVQTFVAGGIVLAASAVAIRGGHLGASSVGAMALVLGVGGYALATSRETRRLRYRNFFYYSYFGLVFVLTGTALLLPPGLAAFVWGVLAIAAGLYSARAGWVSLSLQCTLLLIAAGVASGLLGVGFEALVGDPTAGWAFPRTVHYVVALATVTCLFIPVAQRSERWGTLENMPQLIVLALATWEV
ncbi:MAG: hypothetical protein GTO41_19240, partial [Burkholderiales bacterium]|nr:hypothetical protein [Burkholderiales bacterium]